jgi:hypothetical protein
MKELASFPEEEFVHDSDNDEDAPLSMTAAETLELQQQQQQQSQQSPPPPHASSAVGDRDHDVDDDDDEIIEGVLFGRSVRSTFASLNLAVVDPDDDKYDKKQAGDEEAYHVLVRIQFVDNIKELRSYFRRHCKFGDLLRIRGGQWSNIGSNVNDDTSTTISTEWTEPRLLVHVSDIAQASDIAVQVLQVRYWPMTKCQTWQTNYYRQQQLRKQTLSKEKTQLQKKTTKQDSSNNSVSQQQEENSFVHHSGGLEKRNQGEYIANFLLHMLMHSSSSNNTSSQPTSSSLSSTWATAKIINSTASSNEQEQQRLHQAAVLDYLNSGSGVLDVAGGSGHVSMALGLRGIASTVVDPRENVGKLPGRDRKVWNRALKQKKKPKLEETISTSSSSTLTTTLVASSSSSPATLTSIPMMCQPVTIRPYQTFRAWFGVPPQGVDTSFRTPDQDPLATTTNNNNALAPTDAQDKEKQDVEVIRDSQHPLLQQCRAIVALHPDEATDAIVDMAVKLRVPFVIVPCCVFCRLFPHRRFQRQRRNSNATTNQLKAEGEEQGSDMSDSAGKTMVSTYQDLLDYLQAKDPAIQRATMPFVGANTVLWSTFETQINVS